MAAAVLRKFKASALKNPNLFLETKIFRSHKIPRITTKSDELRFNASGNQLGLLILRLNHDPTKNKYIKKPNFQTILRYDTFKAP